MKTKTEAIAAWNTRPGIPNEAEQPEADRFEPDELKTVNHDEGYGLTTRPEVEGFEAWLKKFTGHIKIECIGQHRIAKAAYNQGVNVGQATLATEIKEITECLESDKSFAFDPSQNKMHIDDGGAPDYAHFYTPKSDTRVKVKDLEWDGLVSGPYQIEVKEVGTAYLSYYGNRDEDGDPECLGGGYLTLVSTNDLKSAANDHHKEMVQSQIEETP